MTTTETSTLAAVPPTLRSFGVASPRHRQTFLAVALVGALAATVASAQTGSSFYRPLTLAAAEPAEGGGGGADSEAQLAMKLQNPVADLISAPIQNNFDFGAGPNGNGFQYLVRIQPVVPITLSKDWNVISRTILPTIYQEKIYGNTSQYGLGDTIQSFFFSPKAPTGGGWIWGAGPVFQFPTATDSLLGQGQWCAGPTVVVLKQAHGWTYGALVNNPISFTGWGNRDVNYLFLQPFLTYTTKKHTSFSLNTESTYDWQAGQWSVPLNLMVSQLVKIGKMPLQFQVGGRYYAVTPDNGPVWGLRFTVTFLLPK